MANVLTGLFPTLFEAANTVSRELVGMIPAVRMDANASRAAKDQNVRVPLAVAGEMEDITPGQQPANTGGTTLDYADVTITKSKNVPVLWNGEEQLAVGSTGTYNSVLADQFTDAMRKLVNAVEADLAAEAAAGASRAYGTAGTAPFATPNDLSDFSGVAQILDDNGAPVTDRQLVLNSAAMANLRGKQSVLFKVNEAGSQDMLRNGMTDRVQDFSIRYSGGIKQHTKGTGTSYTTNLTSSLEAGATNIAVDTGTGTVLAGDVVTFAGDPNKYVVNSALESGVLKIGRPGLIASLADGVAMTVDGNYRPNFAFSRNALLLVSRAPAVPTGGDSAEDATTITDPMTGMTFEVRVYRQYRQVKFEVCLAWGVKAIKPAHIAMLLG